jgi:hypothetical protein
MHQRSGGILEFVVALMVRPGLRVRLSLPGAPWIAAAAPYDDLVSGRFDADHGAATIRERAATGDKKWILLH